MAKCTEGLKSGRLVFGIFKFMDTFDMLIHLGQRILRYGIALKERELNFTSHH